MRRRQFVACLAASGLLALPAGAAADSILISKTPRISEFDLESQEGRYTPVGDFYVRCHFNIPAGSSINSLAITGQVAKPQSLVPSELARLTSTKLGAVLECAGDGTGPLALASNGLWEGWPLEEILRIAKPATTARYLRLTGADGFRRSIPIDRVVRGALLVTHMNGQPLPAEHGAPWRAFFPGCYGMQSVKWLKEIELAEAPLPLSTDEYAAVIKGAGGAARREALSRVLVKSVITYPVQGQVLHRGTVTLRGLAWSGNGRVAAVELSTDGEKTWRVAALDQGGRYEWAIWHYTVAIDGTGIVEFAVRAVDEKGAEQPATRDPNRLDGYANNTIERIQFLVQ